jgi:hypothetical protein
LHIRIIELKNKKAGKRRPKRAAPKTNPGKVNAQSSNLKQETRKIPGIG